LFRFPAITALLLAFDLFDLTQESLTASFAGLPWVFLFAHQQTSL